MLMRPISGQSQIGRSLKMGLVFDSIYLYHYIKFPTINLRTPWTPNYFLAELMKKMISIDNLIFFSSRGLFWGSGATTVRLVEACFLPQSSYFGLPPQC